jgi:hypothetical protein
MAAHIAARRLAPATAGGKKTKSQQWRQRRNIMAWRQRRRRRSVASAGVENGAMAKKNERKTAVMAGERKSSEAANS